MKSIRNFFISISIAIVFSCSSGGGDNGPDPTPVTPPTAATLVFPLNNSECTQGTNVTSTQSTITFDWSDSANTDSYQLVLKNLETQNISNYNSTVSEKDIAIAKGTPFSWYVISKSNNTTQTAQSPTWKFYNAGEAVSSYTPFPADLISPVMGSSFDPVTTKVTLKWEGNDLDNDISGYDILFGTANPPSSNPETTTSTEIEVTVVSGNTYYWRVITKDSQNNSSNSEIFQFKVN